MARVASGKEVMEQAKDYWLTPILHERKWQFRNNSL